MSEVSVEIVLSPAATRLERFAADELGRYLEKLFGVPARIGLETSGQADYRFVVGLISDPLVGNYAKNLPELSDQGHLVRRIGQDTMLLAGGSPAAVAWAMYELVERYGVRYLLHEDVFPQKLECFHLPDVDAVFEPVLKLRSCPLFIDLPTGSVLWSKKQNRAFLRQVFKLKLNGVSIHSYPQAPIMDYEVAGIRRNSGQILFGQKIPIGADNIGFDQLPKTPFLNNPEFEGIESFPELLEAGKSLIRAMIQDAKELGMQISMPIQPMEFPLEFEPLLEKPSGKVQLGGLTTAETGDLNNPNHKALVKAQIEAYLTTYPDIDEIVLELPENPQADRVFAQSWRELAAKYHLEPEFNIDEMVATAQRNYLPAGGPKRAERELKSSISMLNFFDRFLAENDLREKAVKLGTKLGISVPLDAVELYPILDRIIWEGASFCTCLDYSSSRVVRSMACLEEIDASKLASVFWIRLQDDNIGSLPQVCTENIHILMQELRRIGWHGYQLELWPLGDLDPMFAYLARASWDASVTPRDAYEDHFGHLYGEACIEPFCQVMRMLEDATVLLDIDLGPFFPVLGIMEHRIKSEQPMSTVLFHVRATYEQALRTLERLRGLPESDAGKSNLAYWISRLQFAIHALTELEFLCEGGVSVHSADLPRARECFDRAISEGEAAMRAVASQLRDETDRATLATYYHLLVREVRQMTTEYLQSTQGEQTAGLGVCSIGS